MLLGIHQSTYRRPWWWFSGTGCTCRAAALFKWCLFFGNLAAKKHFGQSTLSKRRRYSLFQGLGSKNAFCQSWTSCCPSQLSGPPWPADGELEKYMRNKNCSSKCENFVKALQCEQKSIDPHIWQVGLQSFSCSTMLPGIACIYLFCVLMFTGRASDFSHLLLKASMPWNCPSKLHSGFPVACTVLVYCTNKLLRKETKGACLGLLHVLLHKALRLCPLAGFLRCHPELLDTVVHVAPDMNLQEPNFKRHERKWDAVCMLEPDMRSFHLEASGLCTIDLRPQSNIWFALGWDKKEVQPGQVEFCRVPVWMIFLLLIKRLAPS